MEKKADIIIVGAGASGLTAAIQAAREGAGVLVLEHMETAGKKILSTGNGKCNFTNKKQGIAYYRGRNPAFVLPVLGQFGLEESLRFLEGLGIVPRCKRDGYYYPASGQASSVREVLLMECRRLGVGISCGIGIRSIGRGKGRFLFHTKQGQYERRACILATGGKAAPKTGSDGSGVPYLEGFGHKAPLFVPALVQMQGKQGFLKELAGVRIEGRISLLVEGETVAEDMGEIQLTAFGVSGIPAFQVSRYASYALLERKHVAAELDFLPDLDKGQARERMRQRFLVSGEGKTAGEALVGLFPHKVSQVLLQESGIPPQKPASSLSRKELGRLAILAQRLTIDIIGTKGFDAAQVAAGGVDTEEIWAQTMGSKLVEGLFFAGEIVDIDGMCGGYNLQWAWSSGTVAGRSAARYVGKRGKDGK